MNVWIEESLIFVDFFEIKSLYIYCRGFLELLKYNCEIYFYIRDWGWDKVYYILLFIWLYLIK